MPQVWERMRLNEEGESVVVVPSVTLDKVTERSGSMSQAMEERFLFLLLLLREPRLRMVYVTSMPIAPTIVEYYLALLPGIIPSHARARLSLVVGERLVAASRSARSCWSGRACCAASATSSRTARDRISCPTTPRRWNAISQSALGIPMYGADPRLFELGTKTGCRRLFAEEGVRHPIGFEDLHTMDDVLDATVRLRARATDRAVGDREAQRGRVRRGQCDGRPARAAIAGTAEERALVGERLRAMSFESPDVPFDAYAAKLVERGGIVEELISGTELRSPSVQLRVIPGSRKVELLSTHDQLLGGPSGQSYLGCRFPADFAYARAISSEAMIVGERLAREGVLGRFALDFVVVSDAAGAWTPYAIEINLRKGGTTHPFLTLQFLTDGRYDAATGLFLTPAGREKHLVATDHLESPTLRALEHRRPLRHRCAARPALRPGPADRGGLPHDQLPHRTRPRRPDRRR